MAFPTIESLTPTLFGSNTTSHQVAMPAVVNAGDLLLVFFTNDGSATVTNPGGGWASRGTATNGTNVRASVYAKIAVGNEGGTTVNFVTSATEQAAAQVYRISGWGGDARDVQVSATANGSSAAPAPASLDPGWGAGETLWIAFAGYSSGATVNSYPANYTNGTLSRSATTGTTATAEVATARLETRAASEAPGAFALTATSAWVAMTVAIRSPAIPRFKTVVFTPIADTPANSPRWEHSQGPVTLRLAQNTETGIYTAVAHVVGKPFGAAAEDLSHTVAIQVALAELVTVVDAGGNQRAQTVSAAERNAFAALRDAA